MQGVKAVVGAPGTAASMIIPTGAAAEGGEGPAELSDLSLTPGEALRLYDTMLAEALSMQAAKMAGDGHAAAENGHAGDVERQVSGAGAGAESISYQVWSCELNVVY